MRARIYNDNSLVRLEYDGWDGRVYRSFTIFGDRGYVREWDHDRQDWRQVCYGLSSRGSTLYASASELLALIRREYRAARRQALAEGWPL